MVYSNLLLCGRLIQVGVLLFEIKFNVFCTGVQTFDFGQNMAAWCRFRFQGPSGFGTYISHAELLVQPVVSTK